MIRAFNSDKPFDRFVLEQIAGDELPEGDRTARELWSPPATTGSGPGTTSRPIPKQDRYDQLDDLVNTTSEVFLGLTLGCARCHNHKFEPLTMHDYYRMVAIFEPLERPANGRTERDASDRHAGTDRRSTRRRLEQGYFLHEPSPQAPVSRLLLPGPGGQPGPRSRARGSRRDRRVATEVSRAV